MANVRWLDRSQPQTLQNATILSYIQAAVGILSGSILSPLGLVIIVGGVVGGVGVANEKKWAYWLTLAIAVVEVAYNVAYLSIGSLINLLFWGALVALLLHPQSRDYRKTWFR